jgi:hypothetical protein
MEQIFLLLTLTMESIYLTNREKDTCDADHRLNKAIEYLEKVREDNKDKVFKYEFKLDGSVK